MESDKFKVEVGEVQQSLILPLWARAKETEKKDPVIYDPIAKDIISIINYDFSNIESNKEFAENQQIQWSLRAYHFDFKVREFIETYENATVINIGCGLETTFQRVDNGIIHWVNIELPDVVKLRQKLMPDEERETTIAKSVFDFSWINDIFKLTQNKPVLLMAAGVFFYFSEKEIKSLLSKLAAEFPGSQLVFDVLSSWIWIALTNWAIMRKSGLESSVRLKWYLKKAKYLKNWIETVKVIDEYSIFSRIQPREEWSKKIIRDIKIGNLLKVYNLIHIEI